jgi:molybdopterin/thiamine biosynthesis adenylyltransferase
MNRERTSGLFAIPNDLFVTLIGAGGIGAITGIAMAKMGIQGMFVFDGDYVSDVNIPTQFHRVSDVGNNKAAALAEAIATYSDDTGVVPADYVNNQTIFNTAIVISAVDSITARQMIWKNVLHSEPVQWYIDARMGAEIINIYAIDLAHTRACSAYDALMKNIQEGDVPDVVCTEKATIYTACFAAGHICNVIKKIVKGIQKSELIYHNIPQMRLETFKY